MSRIRIAFFLFLIFGLSFAATDFTLIIPVTAVTVGIFLALMSMLATSLSLPSLQAWVKTEFRELIAGVILVVIIYGLFTAGRTVTSSITGTDDYMAVAENLIENTITNSSVGYDRAYSDVIRAGSKVRVAASYAPYMVLPIYFISLIYSEAPLAGVSPLLSSLMAATQGLANNVMLYEALLLMVKLAEFAIPPIVLPLGLALRMIPFTRQLGNTIIAVSLAAMVFLPFSIIFVDQIHKSINYPQASLSGMDLLKLDFMSDYGGQAALMVGEVLCGSKVLRSLLSLNEIGFGLLVCIPFAIAATLGFWPAFISCFGIPTLAGFTGWATAVTYPLIVQWTQYIYTFIVAGSLAALHVTTSTGIGYGSRAFDVLYPFLREVNNLIVLGYPDAAIIGIITITGVRSLSAALGGEWYMAGIQRLI